MRNCRLVPSSPITHQLLLTESAVLVSAAGKHAHICPFSHFNVVCQTFAVTPTLQTRIIYNDTEKWKDWLLSGQMEKLCGKEDTYWYKFNTTVMHNIKLRKSVNEQLP